MKKSVKKSIGGEVYATASFTSLSIGFQEGHRYWTSCIYFIFVCIILVVCPILMGCEQGIIKHSTKSILYNNGMFTSNALQKLSKFSCAASDLRFPLFGLDDRPRGWRNGTFIYTVGTSVSVRNRPPPPPSIYGNFTSRVRSHVRSRNCIYSLWYDKYQVWRRFVPVVLNLQLWQEKFLGITSYSLGICSIAMWSWESSSVAITHASASSVVELDLGMTSNGLGLSSALAACSVLTLGAWIGAGTDTRGVLGAAFALKNKWSD